jgi:hypothetical protein
MSTILSMPIPNLIGGVSQQPASLRYETQCQEQENAYPSVIEGLHKRHPTEHVKLIDSSAPSDVFVHEANRDTDEQYIVTIYDGTIKVVDTKTGATKNVVSGVEANGSIAYLDDTQDGETYNSNEIFQAVTVADYTYIVNKKKTVALTSNTSATSSATHEALIFLKQSDYNLTHTITIGSADGATVTDHDFVVGEGTSSDAFAANADSKDRVDTTQIMTKLASDINGTTTASITFTASSSGPVIWLRGNAAFSITVSDGRGNQFMTLIKDSVQEFIDLPTVAPNNFKVKVDGNPTETIDDYYVSFTTNGSTFGEGIWSECAAPGINDELDPATMPHLLIRTADGHFRFDKADGGTYTIGSDTYTIPVWTKQLAGDKTTNSDPTFVGSTINDIFFFKNRLGFLTGENVVLSESGEFFNFYRTTVVDLLDTAPIDVASTHKRVALLRHAIPFSDRLILFSDDAQFVFEGSVGTLSPKTAVITRTTDFECLPNVSPEPNGSSIFFPFTTGEFSGVREYFPKDDTLFEAVDLTLQVPNYIQGSILDTATSLHEKVLFVLSSGETSSLYLYKFYNKGESRVQSSWSKYTFGSDADIKGIGFIDSSLYIVVKRSEGLFIEKMTIESGLLDTSSEYLTLLDRRIDNSQATAISYSSATDFTTYTLPYNRASGRTYSVYGKDGVEYKTSTDGLTANKINVRGDTSSTNVWIGEDFTMLYTFSNPILRSQSGKGRSPITEGRQQVRYGSINFSDTRFFNVHVTPLYRDESIHPYSGMVLNAGSNLMDNLKLDEGTFRFPVYSEPKQVTIQIKNDTPFPSKFVSAEFEISYATRSQRFSG